MTLPGRTVFRVVLVLAILAVWQWAPVGHATRFWLSSPSMIAAALAAWLSDGSLWINLESTLLTMLYGYVLGCASGIGLGLVLGLMPRVRAVAAPFLAGFYALPKIALAPLFIVLLGVGLASKVAVVVATVFFLVLSSTIEGVRDVDPDLLDALALMGARRSEMVRKVLIPSAVPWIFTGMRISVRYAFTATLLAELIAANRGIGFLIEFNAGNFNTAGSYAAITVLVVCSVVLTEILSVIESRTSRWRGVVQ